MSPHKNENHKKSTPVADNGNKSLRFGGVGGRTACQRGETGGVIENFCLDFKELFKSFQFGLKHNAPGAADLWSAASFADLKVPLNDCKTKKSTDAFDIFTFYTYNLGQPNRGRQRRGLGMKGDKDFTSK